VVKAPDLVPLTPPPAPDTTYLSRIDPRPQRLRGIDNAAAVLHAIRSMPDVKAATPVVSGPAFAQRGNAVRAVAILGIEPSSYVHIIPINTDIVAGQFAVGAEKILIGSRLASDLGLSIGDTLRLTGPSGQAQAFAWRAFSPSACAMWTSARSISDCSRRKRCWACPAPSPKST
jgi:ABC-type transport system, involved in lipoprotein release, permease component